MPNDDALCEWHWDQSEGHCYVELLPDMQLEWGGWDPHPKGGGGATAQSAVEYLRTGHVGYSWMRVPPTVATELRAAIEARLAAQNFTPPKGSNVGRR